MGGDCETGQGRNEVTKSSECSRGVTAEEEEEGGAIILAGRLFASLRTFT